MDLLDDLSCRFFLNLPPEQLSDISIMVQVQESYWFLIDNWAYFREIYSKTLAAHNVPWDLKTFIMFYKKWFQDKFVLSSALFDLMWSNYIDIHYKQIPIAGVVLFYYSREEKDFQVLMIEGKTSQRWGFPKGKLNFGETWLQCATREMKEETSWNGLQLLIQNKFVVQEIEIFSLTKKNQNDKIFTLYFQDIHKSGYSKVFQKERQMTIITPLRLYFIHLDFMIKYLHLKNVTKKLISFQKGDKKEISDIKWISLTKMPRFPNLLTLVKKNYNLIKSSIQFVYLKQNV